MEININYRSVLDKYKTIRERNDAFNALDPQSQRLEIAWDALKLVVAGSIQASNGCYWSTSLQSVEGSSKELQKVFNTKKFFKQASCEVCQRGAVMLSQIRLGNSISSEDEDRDMGTDDNTKGFGLASLYNMEAEYERSAFNHPYHMNSQEKLANIFCNVLINGDFKKSDRKNYITPGKESEEE